MHSGSTHPGIASLAYPLFDTRKEGRKILRSLTHWGQILVEKKSRIYFRAVGTAPRKLTQLCRFTSLLIKKLLPLIHEPQ